MSQGVGSVFKAEHLETLAANAACLLRLSLGTWAYSLS